MECIELSRWGSELLGRTEGALVRNEIVAAAAAAAAAGRADKIVVSFRGVADVSLSFADEAFAKTFEDLARLEPRPRLAFESVAPDIASTIRFALANRREMVA